jgi:hypothetical protein
LIKVKSLKSDFNRRAPSADFEAAVGLARQRAEWLALVDKLPSAKSNLGKAETALQIEGEKFLAAQDSYAGKANVLRFELEEANAAIRDGTTARERLLDPKNVPGAIAAEYAEAVSQARAAESARHSAEVRLNEIDGKLSAVVDSIKKLSGQEPEEIDPSTWKAPEGSPEWQRDGHHGELESKLKKWREIGRERDAIRAALATATHSAVFTLSGQMMARISSSRLTQGMYCRPSASRPPSPRANSGRNLLSSPPVGESTRPVRASTTRTPASRAGAVAASQSADSWARKPVPAEADSSMMRLPVSP